MMPDTLNYRVVSLFDTDEEKDKDGVRFIVTGPIITGKEASDKAHMGRIADLVVKSLEGDKILRQIFLAFFSAAIQQACDDLVEFENSEKV